MTGIEIVLLFIGVVFMVGSFLITEKLSTGEINKINELSEHEIDKIVDRSLQKAGTRIEEAIDSQIGNSVDKVDRALEKETNEKIMAISEYSDTVVESMNKTHNEIMFLYSMLNDKHTDLTNLSGELQNLIGAAQKAGENLEQSVAKEKFVEKYEESIPQAVEEEPEKTAVMEELENANHNIDVLRMHKEGHSDVEIAQTLDIGIGEVKLIIGLFEGERK